MSTISAVLPYIVVDRASDAIAFYIEAFGASEIFRMTDPVNGVVGHAELRFGASVVLISDEYPDFGAVGPNTLGGTSITLHLVCKSVDDDLRLALKAGAILLRPPKNQSFGERNALLLDPFGYRWMLSQTIETISPEEMQRRWNEQVAS